VRSWITARNAISIVSRVTTTVSGSESRGVTGSSTASGIGWSQVTSVGSKAAPGASADDFAASTVLRASCALASRQALVAIR
jgi:hypothetical protein